MRWQRKDVEIAIRCDGDTLTLKREDDVECIEGVDTFKYLGRILYWSEDNWLEVLRNVGKVRRVWNRLRKMPLREGAETRVSAMFYRAVVQTVLLFGAETWVLSEATLRNLEGLHIGFLRQITGKKAVQKEDRTWQKVAAEKALEKAGSQSRGIYIDRRQETVAEWVALRPIC